MGILTKEQILKADDLKRVKVSVPEWGGDVYVRMLTGSERDAFEGSIIDGDKTVFTNVRAKLCVRTIIDEKGERLFTDRDIAVLGNKSASALNRVFDAAQELNAFRNEDVEELVKNSGSGKNEDSISD